jgi:hypothetical protein
MRRMVEGSLHGPKRFPLHHPAGGPPPHAAHGEDFYGVVSARFDLYCFFVWRSLITI